MKNAHDHRTTRTDGLRIHRSSFIVHRFLAALLALIGTCLFAAPASAAEEDLRCLTDDERAAGNFVEHLHRQAFAALDRRGEAYEALKSADDVAAYQQQLREMFVRQLGGFPERTPLEAKTVRTIDADGFRIENVIFASRPGHHVTANLYLPNGKGPFAGIVVSSGHSRTGKTAEYNQRFGLAMAKNGMAALCFDPIGQGERSQILTADGGPQFPGTTTEHYLVGVGSILVGRNTASYRAWDAMRAIDYLCSRPEIDPRRIGMTGCSGGGTMTSYVMALDDRVACAAPACYLTTFRRLLETIGPQDAEQNVYAQLTLGLDQPDYVLLRAPRPTLISSTTQDFFDIRGAWDNYRQAKRIYGRLGSPDAVDLVEIEGKHGVQPQGLASIAQWMRRWLAPSQNADSRETVSIDDLPTRSAEELQCTPTGQVLSLAGERSVFDLNAEYEAELATQRKAEAAKSSPEALRRRICEVAGIRPVEKQPAPTWKDRGRVQREGYHVDKLVMQTDSGIPLAALTFHPKTPDDDAYLYLHDDGKLGDSAAGEPIEKLVEAGYAVVSLDLRGQGETTTTKRDPLIGSPRQFYLAYLLGQSLTGLRTEDALAGAHFVAYYQKPKDAPRKVHLVGVGQAGVVALHAAALRPELFASVTLRKTPRSWSTVVRQSVPAGALEGTVHGALAAYDLPDLVRLIGPEKVKFED